jgi:S1-C subfamily serine protease
MGEVFHNNRSEKNKIDVNKVLHKHAVQTVSDLHQEYEEIGAVANVIEQMIHRSNLNDFVRNSFIQVYNKMVVRDICDPSVPDKAVSLSPAEGSGFVVTINGKNHILTNTHVVLHSDGNLIGKIQGEDDTSFKMDLVSLFPDNDIAVIRFKDESINERLTPMEFKSSDEIQETDDIYVAGFPKNSRHVSWSKGIISEKGVNVNNNYVLKTDAAINHGNSGGPALIHQDGTYKCIGIVFAKRGGDAQNIGFVIPSHTVMNCLHRLKEGKIQQVYRSPNFGIYTQKSNLEQAQYLNSENKGYYVNYVLKHSTAYNNVSKGDLIVSIDGYNVSETGDVHGVSFSSFPVSLHRYLSRIPYESDVKLNIIRNGQNKMVTLNNSGQDPYENGIKPLFFPSDKVNFDRIGGYGIVDITQNHISYFAKKDPFHGIGKLFDRETMLIGKVGVVKLYSGTSTTNSESVIAGNYIGPGTVIDTIDNVEVHSINDIHNHIKQNPDKVMYKLGTGSPFYNDVFLNVKNIIHDELELEKTDIKNKIPSRITSLFSEYKSELQKVAEMNMKTDERVENDFQTSFMDNIVEVEETVEKVLETNCGCNDSCECDGKKSDESCECNTTNRIESGIEPLMDTIVEKNDVKNCGHTHDCDCEEVTVETVSEEVNEENVYEEEIEENVSEKVIEENKSEEMTVESVSEKINTETMKEERNVEIETETVSDDVNNQKVIDQMDKILNETKFVDTTNNVYSNEAVAPFNYDTLMSETTNVIQNNTSDSEFDDEPEDDMTRHDRENGLCI